MLDKILEILGKLDTILCVVVPTAAVVYFNVKNKVRDAQIKDEEKRVRQAEKKYDEWEHEESRIVISRIKNLCNLFKDKGHADLVQYLQLENGTIATSKIQNMFVTCLAEDDRSGSIQKMIKRLQRIPYSETVCWLDKLTKLDSTTDACLCTPDINDIEHAKARIEDITGIGSVMVAPVYRPDELLLGICVFYYHETKYNGMYKTEHQFLTKFKSAVESVILDYHVHREEKKRELKLED